LDKNSKQAAERFGNSSFAFDFYVGRLKEERERGVTLACATQEFLHWYYTIIDAQGHRNLIKNMTTGASRAGVAMIRVPRDGHFTTAIAGDNRKADSSVFSRA